jgi:photosystem II stability/assembly factor-like uncharacterized protein
LLAGLGVLFLAAAPRTVAHADSVQAVVAPAASTSGLVWVKTGGPLGGLGYDLRARPDNGDVMLVTDAFSGVNRTEDGGRTWVASNTGVELRTGVSSDGVPVFSVTIDPHDNNIVWAGTQSRLGIYRSSDGGRTWVRKVTGVAGDVGISVRGFTVDPIDSRIVYATVEVGSTAWAGRQVNGRSFDLTKGMVYKTVDGGEHWTAIWSGDNLARYVWIDPGNPNVLYVSTGFFDREAANSDPAANVAGGVGILKSTDGGRTWRVLNQSNGLGNLYVGSLFMHPTNPSILLAATGNIQYATGSGVYRSTDAGETWTKALSEPMERPFCAVEISTSSPDVVYAASALAFYRSGDGGRTWNQYYRRTDATADGVTTWGPPGVRAGFPIDLEADRRDPMRVFANLYGGGNFVSENGGKTWANASRGYTGALMLSVAIHPADPAIVYSVARSGVFKSTDRGTVWQGVHTAMPNVSELAAVVVSPFDPQQVLMSDAYTGHLWKSVDGARSWGLVMDLAGIAKIPVVDPNDRNQGFVSIAHAPSDARIIYAGLALSLCSTVTDSRSCSTPTYTGVQQSTDGGKTWQTTVGEGLGLRSILALAVHPANPDIVYAGTGNAGVFKTENGGRTWVPINQGVSSLSIRAIAIDTSSPNTVYLGTGGAAIFKSTDGGASWRVSSAGLMPNAQILALLADPTTPAILWAGDQSAGAYRSVDAGATWVQVNAGLSTRAIKAMAISGDGRTVYAATNGEGVFRLDIPGAASVQFQP